MILTAALMAAFAFIYRIKGGILADYDLFPGFPSKSISAFIAAIIFLISADLLTSALLTIAFILSTAPSLGEEAGGIGRPGKQWGPYIDKGFGTSYAWKKGLQRGIWIGACFAAATSSPWFIFCSALFPVLHYLFQWLYYAIHKRDNWAYAEYAVGALCYGLPLSLYIQGV